MEENRYDLWKMKDYKQTIKKNKTPADIVTTSSVI